MNRPSQNRPENPNTPHVLSGMQILFASILAIGLLLAISFGNRIAAGQRIQESREEMQQQIYLFETEQAVLLEELDYVRDDIYVETWARDDGKMVRPGEVLVIPVPAGMPLPTATPRPIVPAVFLDDEPEEETWQLWWALFFDGPPP